MLKKKKRNILEKVLALGVGYVLAELLVAGLNLIPITEVLIDYKGKRGFYEYMHKMFYVYSKEDETLGFVSKSNIDDSVTVNITFKYNTDDYGFRNKQNNYKKTEIAIVGDSFAYAYGVEMENSWASKLEQLLNVTISNFGVVGYSPWQYNETMKRFPDFFRNKTVLYCLYTNDFAKIITSPSKDYYKRTGRDYFESNSPSFFDLVAVETANDSFFDRTVTSALYHEIVDEKNVVGLSNGSILYKEENEVKEDWTSRENREYLHRNLSEAHKLATENDSQMVVVLFPSRLATLSGEYIKHFQEKKPIKHEKELFKMAKEESTNLGLEVIDLSKPLEEGYTSENPTYNLIDFHLSSYGNQVAAREIACSLERWGYIKPIKTTTENCTEKPTLTYVVTSGIIHLDEIDF
ncbi:hypothetical protein HY636_03980 [Candidatus Woesearchaeota archaeon]|nr:hypothetical protein [Candidatus Woesearchaeota archaeon]